MKSAPAPAPALTLRERHTRRAPRPARSTPAQRRALYRTNSLRVRSILGNSLSQRTLAKRIGLTDGGLSMMLRGRRRLTLEVAQRIARELKITLDELQKRLAKARAR